MSREVLVLAWCDLCQSQNGQQREAQTHTAEVDGLRREIDLCTDHAAMLEGLRAVLEASGRVPEVPAPNRHRGGRKARTGAVSVRPAPTGQRHGKQPALAGEARPYPCPWCSLDYTQSSSLLSHARNVHGLAGAGGHGAVARLLGGLCPLCGQTHTLLDEHCRTEHGATWSAVLRQARLLVRGRS